MRYPAWSLRGVPKDAWSVLLLVALYLPLYWDRVRDGRHLARVDIINQYLPNYTYLGGALRSGDLPGWNPYVASGIPFLGDAVSGWGYLPAMVSFTLLPPLLALQTNYLIHILLAAIGIYAFARITGIGQIGATVTAVMYEYGTVVESLRSVNARAHLTAWIPLALLGLEISLRARSLRVRAAGWALSALALSQMMVGWTGQGSAYAVLILGLYAAFRSVASLGHRNGSVQAHLARHAIDGAAALVAGLGLAAAGLWIRLAVNQDSLIAGGNYERAVGVSRNPDYSDSRELVANLLDPTRYYYVGGAALGLALLAFFVADRERWRLALYGGLLLVMVDLFLKDGVIREIFYLSSSFQDLHEHGVSKGLVMFGFPIAMLAGMAVDAITRWRRPWYLLGGLALVPIFLGLDLSIWLKPRIPELPSLTQWTMIAAGVAILIFSLFLAFRRDLPDVVLRGASYLLVACLLMMIMYDPFGARFGDTFGARTMVLPPPAALDTYLATEDPGGPGEFLQQRQEVDGPFRFVGYGPSILASDGGRSDRTYHGRFRDEIVVNLLFSRAMRLELRSAQGYNPAQSARYSTFLAAVNGTTQNYHDAYILETGLFSPLLRLLNVRYVIAERNESGQFPELQQLNTGYPTVYENDTVRILEITNTLPYAWIVHQAIPAESSDQALALIQSDGFDPKTEAVIEGEVPPLSPVDNGAAEQVAVVRYDADRIRLQASMAEPGLVVVSEMYAYGWNAYVDGERTPLLATDYVLRGVAVPAGDHALEFRYEPMEIRAGIAISITTALILTFLIVQPRRYLATVPNGRTRSITRFSTRLFPRRPQDSPTPGPEETGPR